MPIARADFKAVHPGLTTIRIRGIDTWQFGPRYNVYDILVRDRSQPYDLALSESGISSSSWARSGFALRVGDEMIVAYNDGQVLSTDSSIVTPTLRVVVGDPFGLTTFRAIRTGTAQIGLHRADGYWMPATIVVSNASTRFDIGANDRDAGKVLQMRVGQSLSVTLENLPNYRPWSLERWDHASLMLLVDPKAIGRPEQPKFGFQILQEGRQEIGFLTEPVNCSGANCRELDGKHITFNVSA
jgi:hypothetical protein